MKILHTISGLSINNGGPTQSVFNTVQGLRQQGVDASILTFKPKGNQKMLFDDAFVTALPAGISRLAYSQAYKRAVASFTGDIFHTHSFWLYPVHISSITARRRNTPCVIAPRGTFYPEALTYSKWKKRIFMQLWFKKDLQYATCLHATCKQELEHIRNFGLKNPVAVIPNPIIISGETTIEKQPKKQIGFIGRLHSIKNIETLIHAFDRAKTDEYELVIMGGGDTEYVQMLKNISKKNIKFVGFLEGKAKDNIISDFSYIILPSHSENFGMVVPEALIKGIPVIASKGTPWEELNTYHCGWWVDNDVDTLAATIETAINTPENERQQMGENGRRLVMENYSQEVVAKKMIQLYEWILKGGEKPDFVYG